ncbi:phage tail terminator-like protein [Sinorhizobium meliloti]|uniref:phage tail terminator-like protein n=1 Tax=Rhizobium meliloti TaxID=382 RepID=UPI00299CF5F3|nr:hypothetical protein [Sinorhizobium meliloti]
MSEASMRSAIEFRLQQYLQARTPPVALFFENVKATKPEKKEYVEFTILEGNSRRANLGDPAKGVVRTVRHVGVLQLDVMYPKDTGMGAVTRLASSCGQLFDEWSHRLPDNATVNFKTPKQTSMGIVGEFQRIAVSIPYWRDEKSK